MTWAEEDWERAEPPVVLAPDEVAELVGFLPRSIAPLRGGKANTHLRVRGPAGEDRVLRITQRDPASAAREALLWPRVAPHVPVPAVHGHGVTRAGHPVAVLDFVAGQHPAAVLAARPEAAAAVGRALGRTLAGLTAVPVTEMGLYGPDLSLTRRFDTVADSFVDLIEWSLRKGRARRRLGPERVAAIGAVLDVAAAELEVLDGHPALAHGDYKSPNLLLRGGPDATWEVTAVLDWEFACPFTPMLDIAILLRHRAGFPAGFVDAFGAAYGARAWLPPDWLRLSRIIDWMNLVGFLNGAGDRPALYAGVTELLMATVAGVTRHSSGVACGGSAMKWS